MNLKQFVTETIIEITEGIVTAQEHLRDEWVRINPKPPEDIEGISPMLYTAENGAGVFPLTFDVAITAEKCKGDVGFELNVLNVGLSFNGDSQELTSKVSRITFTVPIAYPLKKLQK